MNERIKELSFEAHKFASRDPRANVTLHADDIFEEKFAELIIQECAAAARRHTIQYVMPGVENYNGRVFVEEAIKKHFGVE